MVEAKLAYIEYDRSKNVTNGKLEVKEVYLVNETLSESHILGDVEKTAYWQIETHIKYPIEIKNKKKEVFLNIVIKDDDDELEEVTFNGNSKMTYYREGKLYFIPSLFNDNKSFQDIPNSVTTAGKQTITLHYKNRQPLNKDLIVLSSISTELYRDMISDLVRIDRRLAEEKTSWMSFEKYYEGKYKKYEDILERLENCLLAISKNPKSGLGIRNSKKSIFNLKHANNKSIINAINTGKEHIMSIDYYDDFNIYENRAIRKYIDNLRRMLVLFKKHQDAEYETYLNGEDLEEDSTKEVKSYLKKVFDLDYNSFAQIKEKCKAESIKEKCKPVKLDAKTIKEQPVTLKATVTDEIKYIYEEGSKKICIKPGYNQKEKKWFPFSLNFKDYETFVLSNFSLELDEYSKYQFAFLLYYINDINKRHYREEIEIEGYVQGDIYQRVNNKNYPIIGYNFVWISKIKAGDKEYTFDDFFDDFCKNQKLRENVFDEQTITKLIFSMISEDDSFRKFAYFEKHNLVKGRESRHNEIEKWDKLIEKIDYIISKMKFLDVKYTNEKLLATNVFRKEKRYREVYQILSEINIYDDLIPSIGYWGEDKISIGKSEKLFEYWCYIKILDIFMNTYDFKLVDEVYSKDVSKSGNVKLRESISKYLSSGKIEESSFVLYLKSYELWMKIVFNGGIKLKSGKQLRPDYLITFYRTVNGVKKIANFCFDAKYKNFEEQEKVSEEMTYSEWMYNLFEVAANKYFIRLNTESEIKISGSFIIHSDISSYQGQNQGQNKKWDHKQYYGGINNTFVKQYYGGINNLLEKEKQAKNLNLQYKIGAVAMLPKHDIYMKNLIRMIMEHLLGEMKFFKDEEERWRKKCWICGSEDLTCQKTGNFEKYYISCNSCKEFWVQTYCCNWNNNKCQTYFAKHQNNYFEQDESNSWNVYCPKCNSTFDGKPAWYLTEKHK